jgi:glucuronate isomerase
MPIFDYHNHLSADRLASNTSFRNLTEAWLQGDHYKWRAMRANGIAEEYWDAMGNPADVRQVNQFLDQLDQNNQLARQFYIVFILEISIRLLLSLEISMTELSLEEYN